MMILNPHRFQAGGGGGGLPPTSFAGLRSWLDFTDISQLFTDTAGTTPVTANAQSIRNVSDKGAVGVDFTSADTNCTYRTGLVNGKSGVRVVSGSGFTGAASSNYATTTAVTLMLVIKISGLVLNSGTIYNNAHLWGNGQAQYFGMYGAASPDRLIAYSWDTGADSVVTAQAQGSFVVVQMRVVSGSLQLRINNGAWQTVTGATGPSGLSAAMRLCISGESASTLEVLHAVAYNVALSDANADSLRDWALAQIGL